MALAGRAFLALWNDIARPREAEYDRWHTHEHVPERVAVKGFVGARRYVNRLRADHRYFTLYALDDLAALEHPEYLDLVDNPTAWSASMRPHFANVVRATGTLSASEGQGIGGALAVLAFRGADAAGATDAVMRADDVVACHVGESRGATSPVRWTERLAGTAQVRDFDRLVLIEALDRARAERALDGARITMRLASLPRDFGNDVYDLAFVFP